MAMSVASAQGGKHQPAFRRSPGHEGGHYLPHAVGRVNERKPAGSSGDQGIGLCLPADHAV